MALLIVGTAAAALIGCGGSDSSTSSGSAADSARADSQRLSPPSVDRSQYVDRAEAVCRRSIREARDIGEALPEAVSGASSPQVGITTYLVKPGIEILSREAERLRGLGSAPPSSELEIYLGLFEPIVELSRQRLQAGLAREADRGSDIEKLVAELANEQSAAARAYGLDACSIKFTRALLGAA